MLEQTCITCCFQVPIEKVFAKTLINKFPWAMDVDPRYRFLRSQDPTNQNGENGGMDQDDDDDEDSD